MLSFFSRFSRATPLAERLTHRYRSGAKETLDLSRMCLTDEAIPEILSFLQTHPEITHLILVRIITNVNTDYYDREQFIRRSNLQEMLL